MTDALRTLQDLGQSPWLDNITRDLLRSGTLAAMVRAGHITGLTSNPTIFEQAIAKSADYDQALSALVRTGKSAAAIVDTLTIEDVRAAADVFAPVYARTKRTDGYVSIEVDPTLAHDAIGTLREAKRIWRAVNRPNLMVKIPATREGVAAIEEAIAVGINVNVTLIFSLTRYGQVMDAYIAGLTRRLETGARVDRIASVASFFVSRVDSAVDRLLDERIAASPSDRRPALERLRGKAAIANARLAYAAFRERFGPEHFALLTREGAHRQRPLWASTSTKNPAYPDIYYVEALVGRDTVNTLPPATLDAYQDHGQPEIRIESDLDRARALISELAAVGIDLDRVTDRLETEGVAAFVSSYRSLVDTVAVRREAALTMQRTTETLGALTKAVDTATTALDAATVTARLWKKDVSLWPGDEAAHRDMAQRLGWLDLAQTMSPQLPALRAFADEVRGAGFTHAVLCGMGGSSLAPEVLRRSLGVRRGFLDLTVLDSTDPAAVLAAERRSDPARTLYLFSSKSGDTIEVQSFLAFFWDRLRQVVGDQAGQNLVAITDPGTRLEALARDRRFRRCFLNPSDIGGRYSALSLVGLVPAALMGHDVEKLLERARRMFVACGPAVRAARNPGVRLGAVLASAALRGRDKLTFVVADKILGFADWAEQLIAESTGKQGLGIVPVVGEALAPPAAYGSDRLFAAMHVGSGSGRPLTTHARAGHPVVALRLSDAYDLAGEFVRWEIATAVASHLLTINPFDQPNVQETKVHTARVLADAGRGTVTGIVPSVDRTGLADELWRALERRDAKRYLAITAYLVPNPRRAKLLGDLRLRIRKRFGIATTLGYGPRFLHSTGQLHKGGPANVTVLQLTTDDPLDVLVPGTAYSFGVLKQAQATGDAEALLARGRPVVRVDLGRNIERGLEQLLAALARRPAKGRPARRPSARSTPKPARPRATRR